MRDNESRDQAVRKWVKMVESALAAFHHFSPIARFPAIGSIPQNDFGGPALLPIPLSPRRTLRVSRQGRAAPVSAARAARAGRHERRMMEAIRKVAGQDGPHPIPSRSRVASRTVNGVGRAAFRSPLRHPAATAEMLLAMTEPCRPPKRSPGFRPPSPHAGTDRRRSHAAVASAAGIRCTPSGGCAGCLRAAAGHRLPPPRAQARETCG